MLYHETTHVLAAAVAEGRAERDAQARFFAEGLAEYLAYRAAAASAEGDVPPGTTPGGSPAWPGRATACASRTCWIPEAFLARHDEYLLYALGEVWVAALVEACGQPARDGC